MFATSHLLKLAINSKGIMSQTNAWYSSRKSLGKHKWRYVSIPTKTRIMEAIPCDYGSESWTLKEDWKSIEVDSIRSS